ncbi:MAG: sugar transferase [Chloroflexota bacterium]
MIRRLIDISVSLIGLFVLLPLFLLISIWIRFDSPGPIFYRARRSGKNGKVFGLYKFRSMIVDADKNGPGITTACDTRITHSGRFLRKTKLDELPQLVNVLCGHMSLVGPRPEDPRYVELYTDTQREVLKVKPGITSAASLKFRNEAELLSGPNWEDFYRNEVMPNKLAIDLEYLSQRNLLTDGLLILRTTAAMFR